MKKMNVYVWMILVVGIMIGGQACKEEAQHAPINKNEDKPLSVLNPKVENHPGASEITYNLPQSEGVLYVKAVYEIRPGVIQEAKASFYSNSIRVEGFGKAGEYEIGRAHV